MDSLAVVQEKGGAFQESGMENLERKGAGEMAAVTSAELVLRKDGNVQMGQELSWMDRA